MRNEIRLNSQICLNSRTLRWIAVVATVACASAAPAAVPASSFPRTIEPWHAIGGIGIGEVLQAVNYHYQQLGAPPPGYRNYYDGTNLVRYGAPGASVVVGYPRRNPGEIRVVYLETNSPAFKTPDGIGVGARIPLGRCHKERGLCRYLWRGFEYGAGALCLGTHLPGGAWFREIAWGGRHLLVQLNVEQGRVTKVVIGVRPPPIPSGEECD
jgi:hypothetical protein